MVESFWALIPECLQGEFTSLHAAEMPTSPFMQVQVQSLVFELKWDILSQWLLVKSEVLKQTSTTL